MVWSTTCPPLDGMLSVQLGPALGQPPAGSPLWAAANNEKGLGLLLIGCLQKGEANCFFQLSQERRTGCNIVNGSSAGAALRLNPQHHSLPDPLVIPSASAPASYTQPDDRHTRLKNGQEDCGWASRSTSAEEAWFLSLFPWVDASSPRTVLRLPAHAGSRLRSAELTITTSTAR